MRVPSLLRSLPQLRYLAFLSVLVSLVALTAPADAQTLLRTLDTPNPGNSGDFGISLAVGDVNGDGKADVVVGAPGESVGANPWQGHAYVFSGADGSLLFTLNTPDPQTGAYFGSSVAVGDVNGDGKGDIVVGAPSANVSGNAAQGRAYVFSGADGSLLFTLNTPNPQANGQFGNSLAIGDLNGDGKGEIAVGASNENVGANGFQGRVYVFSGIDGSLLFTLNTPNPQASAYFGTSVAIGDVNGDGNGEIAVGASYETVGANGSQGRVYVFSSAGDSVLFTLDTPNPQAAPHFGNSLAIGDVNGDGKGDIAVGAYHEAVGANSFQGRAYVFSGADQSLLFTLNTPAPQSGAYFGNCVAIGDVNGDDKGDIAVGAPDETVGGTGTQGRAYVFSGADGSLLATLDTPDPRANAYFGFSLGIGDVNGDGRGEAAVGEYQYYGSNQDQGRAYIFSFTASGTSTPTATATSTNTPASPTATATATSTATSVPTTATTGTPTGTPTSVTIFVHRATDTPEPTATPTAPPTSAPSSAPSPKPTSTPSGSPAGVISPPRTGTGSPAESRGILVALAILGGLATAASVTVVTLRKGLRR